MTHQLSRHFHNKRHYTVSHKSQLTDHRRHRNYIALPYFYAKIFMNTAEMMMRKIHLKLSANALPLPGPRIHPAAPHTVA